MEPGSIIVPAQLRDAIVHALVNAVHPSMSYGQVLQILQGIKSCKPAEVVPLQEGPCEPSP